MIAFVKRYLGFFLLLLGVIGLLVSNLISIDAEESPSSATTTLSDAERVTNGRVYVDIKGEVLNPGVYQMKSTDRIGDVISSAGGVTEYADLTEINLAMILEDQMILLIPRQQTDLVKTSVTDVFVDIKGEVMYPGLYSVPSTYRIFDLISRAGGLTPYADTSLINLSSWVEDQMVIVIPSYLKVEETNDSISKSVVTIEIKGEVVNPGLYSVDSSLLVRDVINLAGGVTEYADLSDLNLSQNIVKNMSIVIQKKVTSSVINNDTGDSIETSDDERTLVNINTAMLDELDTLPGIGYIIAQRIIDYRAEYGPFESIEDIMNVSGIKESVYDQIKELICI